MSKHKQIDSELHCRATATLQASANEDLHEKDKPLKDLLGEDVNEKTENNEQNDC